MRGVRDAHIYFDDWNVSLLEGSQKTLMKQLTVMQFRLCLHGEVLFLYILLFF